MGVVTRLAARVVCVALAAVAVASAGCGTSAGGGSGWKEIATAEVSGKEPVKQNLGTHELGREVRLAFALSGPKSPNVQFTLLMLNAKSAGVYKETVTPTSDPDVFARDKAITLSQIRPGVYRIFFTQRFAPADGPGYDIALTLSTHE